MARFIEITTKLGPGVFDVQRLSGQEALSRLFEYQVTLISERPDIQPQRLLGTNATVRIEMPAGQEPRYVNGYIARFGIQGEVTTPAYKTGRGFRYLAVLRPWLWFLTRTSTCQIFLKKKVPDIVGEVFARHGSLEWSEKRLQSTAYATNENCVQYRETDFNFVSRLLEREGIYYAFEHSNGKHQMVWFDDPSAHKPKQGYARLAYQKIAAASSNESETITDWDASVEVQSGRYALDDYNFLTPKVDLVNAHEISRPHDLSAFEMFDYHGDYQKPVEGAFYSKLRIEELQCRYEMARGSGTVRGIEAGRTFKLSDHPVDAINQEYLVVTSDIEAIDNGVSSGVGGGAEFHCHFSVIPKTTQFRPARTTPGAIVQGPQTAVVVGPAGEEIYTDEHGRVKVQFHWDRYSKSDENSSCWVRVSQPWAGKGWGMIALPRIGQEVIVEFLEGDPDCPIITGRVHNADQKPPYELPANATRTGIITHSSKGGGKDNFNELRFEDKKGSEQVFVHAEKDLEYRAKHDRIEWIGNEAHFIVKKGVLEQFDADYNLTLKGDHNEKLDGTLSFKIGMDMQVKSGMKAAIDAGQEIHLKAGMNVVIEAGAALTLKVGGNFINIGPAGVFIKGTMVMINSGGAAGSGSGASPIAPKAPREADKGQGGETGAAPPASQPPKPKSFSPQAVAFQEAAASGVPFCAQCAAAAAAAAGN